MQTEKKKKVFKDTCKPLVCCSRTRQATPPTRPNSILHPHVFPELYMDQRHTRKHRGRVCSPRPWENAFALNLPWALHSRHVPAGLLATSQGRECGPQAGHGRAGTFHPARAALPNPFTPPRFQHLRHETARAACPSPASRQGLE